MQPACHDRHGHTRGGQLSDRRDIAGVNLFIVAQQGSVEVDGEQPVTTGHRQPLYHLASGARRYYDSRVLRDDLVKGLPAGVSGERVAATVARIAAAGRAAWPAVSLSEDVIFERLCARLQDNAEAHLEELRDAESVPRVRARDGQPRRTEGFRRRHGPANRCRAAPVAAGRRHRGRGQASAARRAPRRSRREDRRLRGARRPRGVAADQRDPQGVEDRPPRGPRRIARRDPPQSLAGEHRGSGRASTCARPTRIS